MVLRTSIFMDNIVEKGWYKIIMSNKQRFTGQCTRIKNNISFTFDIGESENETIVRKEIFMLHKDDIKNAIRLSPRYIEQIVTNGGGWRKIRYKGLLKYGEE